MSDQLKNLIATGIPEAIAKRILADVAKNSQPKETKKKKPGKWFPGMSESKNKKRDVEIDVLVVCECCGGSEASTRIISTTDEDPKPMKLATSICNKCPDYLRQFSHKQLVALVLTKEHPGIKLEYKMNRSHVKFALKHTPEEIVALKLKTF